MKHTATLVLAALLAVTLTTSAAATDKPAPNHTAAITQAPEPDIGNYIRTVHTRPDLSCYVWKRGGGTIEFRYDNLGICRLAVTLKRISQRPDITAEVRIRVYYTLVPGSDHIHERSHKGWWTRVRFT